AKLVEQLRSRLADGRTPALLRMELARVLYTQRELDPALLRHLMDSANPAPLRLIAVDALLEQDRSTDAIAPLPELARMPTREIALGIAQVVQRRLSIDLGLPRDRPLPPLHSREAAEVARNVLLWANHQEGGKEAVLKGDDSDEIFRLE